MASIKDILTIDLEDEIQSVINLNSQKDEEILSELSGFILTESLAKHLNDFLDQFISGAIKSGVWLSGFYGSGKSYFAKMLGFILKNPILNGTSFRDRFLPKLTGLADRDILENNLGELNRFKNHVVLFDAAKSSEKRGFPYMIFANFLRSLGLLDNWIGLLEYDLLLSGRYNEFLSAVQQNENDDWYSVRADMLKSPGALKRAIISLGLSEEEYKTSKGLADRCIQEYDANKLQEHLQRYLNQNSDTRIVFMIDEVSEAIKQDKINLLDLEGVAEALAAMGRSVWTISIAQLKLDDVISLKNVSRNQLIKVRDRFRMNIDIKAEEVDVIIKQRLLAKVDGARNDLKDYYNQNSGAIRELTNLQGLNLRPTDNPDTYADYYPFHEYQFRMLQYFLFGSSSMAQTKAATRGMVISAFDVLKKEVKRDYHEHAHVTATQLCNQAELSPEEEQRIRYEQAANALNGRGYNHVDGKKLLQTIYFLTRTEVTQTTLDNICRAYVDSQELYYEVRLEINDALNVLVDNQIVLFTNNQYRITNQTEHRILEDMNNYDVQPFMIRSEITRALKTLPLLRDIRSINIDSVSVGFNVSRDDGENIVGNSEDRLKIHLHDIFVINERGDRSLYINEQKQQSQEQKDCILIIPEIGHANEIANVVTAIKRIEYISDKNYTTEEERHVVLGIKADLDAKKDSLNNLLRQAYANGDAIYQYATYQLNDAQFNTTIKQLQRKMFDNIFTKHLSSQLSEKTVPRVFTERLDRLHALFGHSEEFKFFDTSGQFIGTNLSVTTEILSKATAFITGAELERQLSAPPTGYSIGTIMTTMAALFRGNKVIAKFNGTDYNSPNDTESRTIFQSTKNFGRASFKAVSQSLSYNERSEIVYILKDDCNYRTWTGENISYQSNDFDLVNAIRDLSKAIISKVNQEIADDTRLSQLFAASLQAKTVFQPFTPAVNDGNCFSQARSFLSQQDDFIKAVERVEKDLDFIENNFTLIEQIKEYINSVKEELRSADCDMHLIDPIVEQFKQCYETDVVRNFQMIQEQAQKAKDLYFTLFKGKAERVTVLYTDLRTKAEGLRHQINAYPPAWNQALLNKIDQLDNDLQRYQINNIDIPQFAIQCRLCHKQLRDLTYAENMVQQQEQKLMLWQTEIVTTDPTPPAPPTPPDPSQPTPPSPPATPKTRNMRSQLPSGMLSVEQYRTWLSQQLSLLNGFDTTDRLDFNN